MKLSPRIALLVALAAVLPASAQPLLHVPQASPRAEVSETFGITDVTVAYHRPAVNGRKVWGGLVPYDVLWRAGANENTTVRFSTAVTVEGQPVAAGTYSVFFIPSPSEWTAVLNRFTGGWGTYSHDPAEDVLRVKVRPQPAAMQERLAFTFDDSSEDAVTLSLRWENLRVPLRIGAETRKLTMAGIDQSLRSALHWVPQAWREAAAFAARNGDTEAALRYVDAALQLSPDGPSLRLKARLLEKKGDARGAQELRDKAAAVNPEVAFFIHVYELMGAKKLDEARAAVEKDIAGHPDHWRSWSLLGTIHANAGHAAESKAAFEKAMSLAPGQSERVEVQDSINELASAAK